MTAGISAGNTESHAPKGELRWCRPPCLEDPCFEKLAEAWAVHELSRVALPSAAMNAPFPLENQRNPSPVKTLTRFALPLLAYLASGCGLTDPDIPEIAGKWTGTDNDGDRWELELTENESGGLSGTYTLQIVGSLTFRDSVTGRYEYPVG